MQRMLRSLLIAALLVTAGRAFADDHKDPSAGKAGTTPKTKIYDFTGDTIEGDRLKPDGSTVTSIGFDKQPSLIRIRTSFIKEIVKSAEDL